MTRRLPVCSDDDGMHVKLPAEAETLFQILETLKRIEERMSVGAACGHKPAIHYTPAVRPEPCEHDWKEHDDNDSVGVSFHCKKCGAWK